MKPGDEVELALSITTPPKDGMYFPELDMVQEEVSWFKDKGSATAKVNINVWKSFPQALNMFHLAISSIKSKFLSVKFSPRMEMYGMHRNEVIELIKENGGQIVNVLEYNVSGEEWLEFSLLCNKIIFTPDIR